MAEASPQILSFELGPWATNCYVVAPPATEQPTACWIIDASFEPDALIDEVRRRGWQPQALVLTHAHLDHIAGGFAVRAAFPGLPVWIHQAEADWLADPTLNLSAMAGLPVTCPGPDRLLRHREVLRLGSGTDAPDPALEWHVRHTPGHSPGGIALVHAGSPTAFVGDALFAGSVGRTDFPGSDADTLHRSIREQLYTLPDQTRVFPGHGPPTTIGRERRTNPFVRS